MCVATLDLGYNHTFPHRFGSREPELFQFQPLQSPLPSAAQVPQVSAACQRGEQGEESPGGPAAAGTRGEDEGVQLSLAPEGSIQVFPIELFFNPKLLIFKSCLIIFL